jgi:hypothetical protein
VDLERVGALGPTVAGPVDTALARSPTAGADCIKKNFADNFSAYLYT